MMTRMFKEEGGALFDSRSANLGHTLQGNVPSPADRSRAVRLSLKCMTFLEREFCAVKDTPLSQRQLTADSAAVIIFQGSSVRMVSVVEMAQEADMKNRRGKDAWWLWMKDLTESLVARNQLI
jgi:6-phosphofructokinase 1